MLPKLSEVPKYTMVMPSTQKEVNYRPYLVKEEKVLMLAFESGDQRSSMRAVADVIVACVDEDIKPSMLTTYDVEYMFTQIRARSVGETSKVLVKCTECSEQNEVVVDLDNIFIEQKDADNMVHITDDIIIEMKHPSFMDVVAKMKKGAKDVDVMFDMLKSCIEAVHADDQKTVFKDEPEKDQDEFLESLSSAQMKKIKDYLEAAPKVKYKMEFDCKKCGHHNEHELEGMQNFLS
jgi:DNA-directed RNA polymerase subunit M/transcription elongation factor TFIIS